MSKKIAVFAVVLVLITLFNAYTVEIPYVDVQIATTRVNDLEARIATLNADLQKRTDENIQLEIEYDRLTAYVSELRPILEKVQKKAADLNVVYSKIVDKATRAQAKEAVDRNTDLINRIRAEMKQANLDIQKLQNQISLNKTQMEINENRIRKNADDLWLLNASIEKTNNQTELITDYIGEISSFLNEAETVIREIKEE